MVNSNKILTVSYGTFSCTLEGFDDSFGTMKAIAEYFRDLAADDRFFGAEPPQPDAEMMAVIAQREASRPVRARHDDSGIVLRAADTVGAVNVPAAAAAFSRISADDPVVDAPVESAPVEATVDAPLDIQPEPAVPEEKAPEAETVEATQDAPAGAEPAVAESADETASVQDVEPVVPETAKPTSDMTAKLERIRAVVAQNEDLAFDDTEETEEELGQDLEAAASYQFENDEDHAQHQASISDVLDKIEDEGFDADAEDELDTESLFADLGDDEAEAPAPVAPVALQLEAKDRVEAEGDEEESAAPLVLIKKMKRSEVDAALASGLLEEVEDDFVDDSDPDAEIISIIEEEAPIPDGDSSSLSQEDEDELMRELAEVEAEFVDIAVEDNSENATEDAAFLDIQEPQEHADDVDVSRLMDAAAAKLDDPESASNADAYTHLRAAVAAAEAEREAGGDVDAATPEAPFREDLAQVVKPRRPERPERSAREEMAELPAPRKVAPLKLVAEQRVIESAPSTPVRPRRVIAPAEIAETDENNSGFLEFMAGVDAIGLEEQLEAAAAYLTYVEKRDGFTRPQLMNKVRVVHNVDFNREDGLRAFGKLLRTGKLVKSGGGRFVASADIGYQPGERAAI